MALCTPLVTQVSSGVGLDAVVQLPGGYRTTRRDVLKLGTLGIGGTALYVALSRSQVRGLEGHVGTAA